MTVGGLQLTDLVFKEHYTSMNYKKMETVYLIEH